ncbi:DUF5050 domain-containing protein [Anaeromicropila populeti]|uniref:Prolow-density lipoprotein receptor-related protein 1-like beta-propeller domain-containing protein n=1 Tax=Anaeromicropila populeti TaxID=37658 RepID=A0A1I6JB38_9FIRM|nr:DUF5050 domain-containing protein [Anaeromicropila populeti]SFR76139.1 protein of unknown function [Anaeromicropila populeti]
MKKTTIGMLFLLLLVILCVPMKNTNVKAAGYVYTYSNMVEHDDVIYYIKSDEATSKSAGKCTIYGLDVKANKKSKIAVSNNTISNLFVYKDILYYTTYTDDYLDITYSVSLDTNEKTKICQGDLHYVDENGIVYSFYSDSKYSLYKANLDGRAEQLIYEGTEVFDYVKAIGSKLYFYQTDITAYKIKLMYMKSSDSKLTVLTTDKFEKDNYSTYYLSISDIVEMNGNIFYQYGNYEGTGNFWYGVLKKIDKNNKKKTVYDSMTEPEIYHDTKYIYLNYVDNSNSCIKYNTKTGKKTKYTCEINNGESLSVIDSKSYSASTNNQNYITVSRFSSGTDKKNLKKNFIKFSYKQNSNLTYYADVEKLGSYFLVYVERIDYNDTSYGWRGKYVGIQWYVADAKGKVVANFS